MQNMIIKPYEKRVVFAGLLLVALALLFWGFSRYPALNEKAIMSGSIVLEDALSFEAKFLIPPDMVLWQKILYSTGNWIYTNKQGMAFGLLFGAAFLTLFGYLQQRSFKNGPLNSVMGLFIGAPLGVCVNCAAPIAKGMYASGMRAEATLSAMIASPTLNMVVITLMISVMPVYMVVAKIGLSLLIILIVVPLICKMLPKNQLEITPVIAATGWDLAPPPPEPLGPAIWAVITDYAKNLWYIIRMTVPLMLLAGFLGSAVATVLPAEMLSGVKFMIWVAIIVALVGVFLPVPIAFDVVMAGTLLSAGLEPGYVMVLLFTLGSFSIYSYFIVAQTISMRAANLLTGVIVVLGIAAGIASQSYYTRQVDRALDLLLGHHSPEPYRSFSLIGAAHAQTAVQIDVTALPFAPRSPAGTAPFTRIEGWEIGIDKPIEFSFQDMWPPFWEGRSLASGDIDRDGDLDLVIASTYEGLYVYANDGDGSFARQHIDLVAFSDAQVFNAALVDLNNNGWLDLFITTYRTGNFVVHNTDGIFDFANPTRVANQDNAVVTLALSFGDVNGDGFVDAALGNWAAGWYRRVPGEESRNRIVLNDAGMMDGSHFTALPAPPGETLSIVIGDANGDGLPDLLEGNDFEMPDAYYLGDGLGGLDQITYDDGIISKSTTTTMAVKLADLHNDGVPEIYLAQIAGRSSGVSETLKMQPLARYCDGIKRPSDKATCAKNMAIKSWYKSGNNFDPSYASKCTTLNGRDKTECKAMLIKDLAIQRKDAKVCKLIPKSQPNARAYCDIHFWPIRAVTAPEAEAAIPQILRSNVLLERSGAKFDDVAEAQGLHVGGWSWDTKIGDFDLDGFQDVYIVNGTWVPNEVSPSNLFFHNTGDGKFTEASGPFGLEDYLMTAAATAFDLDNDGDLDMVSHPVNGPISVFINNAQDGRAIGFELIDDLGNRDGMGAVVMVQTRDGQTLTREVQLGSGFMSFDAPRVMFGLGMDQDISDITIRWRDGQTSPLGALQTGALYRVHRQ